MSFRGNVSSPSWAVADQDLIVSFVGWSIVNSMVALYHSGIQSLSGEICSFPPFLDVIRMAFVCLSVGGFGDAIIYVCSASLSKNAWIKLLFPPKVNFEWAFPSQFFFAFVVQDTAISTEISHPIYPFLAQFNGIILDLFS